MLPRCREAALSSKPGPAAYGVAGRRSDGVGAPAPTSTPRARWRRPRPRPASADRGAARQVPGEHEHGEGVDDHRRVERVRWRAALRVWCTSGLSVLHGDRARLRATASTMAASPGSESFERPPMVTTVAGPVGAGRAVEAAVGRAPPAHPTGRADADEDAAALDGQTEDEAERRQERADQADRRPGVGADRQPGEALDAVEGDRASVARQLVGLARLEPNQGRLAVIAWHLGHLLGVEGVDRLRRAAREELPLPDRQGELGVLGVREDRDRARWRRSARRSAGRSR